METQKPFFYEPSYIDHVAQSARRLLEARDAYLHAWVEWSETCLGASAAYLGPAEEGALIEGLLEKLVAERVEE